MKEASLDFDTPEYKLAIALIEKTNQSFFLTGKAGTGKSTFLRHIIDTCERNFLVLAPTGIAAINIGGVTIHSFFEFPLRQLLPEEQGIKTFWRDSEKRNIISALDTIVIDEVSMVRADLIDAIDCSLRRNGGNANLPFGGKQVVFVGDLFQLEPIMPTEGDGISYKETYKNGRFYNARVFSSMSFPILELTNQHRQKDHEFVALLDKVRANEISDDEISKLNSRVIKRHEPSDYALTLTTRSDAAEGINGVHIKELITTSVSYNAQVSEPFEAAKFPTDRILTLKKGAQVIFIRNDAAKRWVNGTIGKVMELSNSSITVSLPNGVLTTVERVTWEQIRYEFNESRGQVLGKVVGKFVQYPLKLAWAITIHKSQGMTLDQAIIDFGSGAFAGGQTYVALSRVRTLAGLFLNQPIKRSDIIVDESLKTFVQSLPIATTSLLIDNAQAIRSKNPGSIAGYYLRIAMEKIGSEESIVLENLTKAFAYLTHERDLSIIDSSVISNINNDTVSGIQSPVLRGILLFFLEKPQQSLDSFLQSGVVTELVLYFMSKCHSALNDQDKALTQVNLSLDLVRNSRNLYQKAKVLKLRKDLDEGKKLYLEYLSDAFLADNYSSTVYSDLLVEIATDNFSAQLPSVYEFERAVNELDSENAFFRSIVKTVNRYRKKQLNITTKKTSPENSSDILQNWNANGSSIENVASEDPEDFFENHNEDLRSEWSLD